MFTSPKLDLAGLGGALRAFDELCHLPDEQLYGIAEGVSGWCIAQHLEHCMKAMSLSLKGSLLVLKSEEPPKPMKGPVWRTWIVLLFHWIPRGKVKAPPRVAPEDRPARESLVAQLQETKRILAEIGSLLPKVATEKGRVLHPVLGGLTPRQWLRFLLVHNRHHLAIVGEIQRSRGA